MSIQEKRKMKRWLLPLLLFVSMFFSGGCDSDEDGDFDPSDYMVVELSPLSDEARAKYYTEPLFVDKVYKNQKGMIVMHDFGNSFHLIIRPLRPESEGYMPLTPANMPEEYWIEGTEIVFSGERINCETWDMGSLPLVLTDLKVKKDGVIK